MVTMANMKKFAWNPVILSVSLRRPKFHPANKRLGINHFERGGMQKKIVNGYLHSLSRVGLALACKFHPVSGKTVKTGMLHVGSFAYIHGIKRRLQTKTPYPVWSTPAQ